MILDENIQLAAAEAFLNSVCIQPYDVVGDGSVMVRCNSRLSSRCPSCSKLFQNDWAAIARSGIFDADGQTLQGYSWVMVTLTAPSFGKVHRVPHRMSDRRVKCPCGVTHEFADELAGEPIRPASYDFRGTLLFNQSMGRLWNNTVTRWRRRFGSDFQYFAVTEAQKRGVMHKHVLVRFESGILDPTEFLTMASVASTRAWSGQVLKWGGQSDVQVLNVAGNPEEAAKSARYLVKAVSYSVKDVNHATGSVSRAANRLMRFAAYEYPCSAECDRPDGGRCEAPIHYNLVGTERVLSQSKKWSETGSTRTGLREARRVYAQALHEDQAPDKNPRVGEGISQGDLLASRVVQRYRGQLAMNREAFLREQWDRLHPETSEEPLYHSSVKT